MAVEVKWAEPYGSGVRIGACVRSKDLTLYRRVSRPPISKVVTVFDPGACDFRFGIR